MKRLVHAILFAVLLVPTSVSGQPDGQLPGKKVRAMTQNLYLGVEVTRLLFPEPGNPFCDPVVTPLCTPATVNSMIQTVVANDFPARAAVMAEQIKRERPDVIGLQEVSLVRTESPGDFLVNGMVDAEDVLLDFLEVLLDALAAVDADYSVAAVIENADVEVPWLVGFDGMMPLFDDARLTDRDVILVRSSVQASNPGGGHYATNLSFELGGVEVEFTRGYVTVDARIRGTDYLVVNTHLEFEEDTVGGFFQSAQAMELIALLAEETRPIIMMGDFNSSPDDPASQPYALLSDANYVDIWTMRDDGADGFTCCQDEDLMNPLSLLSERVDMIWVRNDRGGLVDTQVGPLEFIDTIGDREDDRTASGLWPSDHAGIMGAFRVPRLGGD